MNESYVLEILSEEFSVCQVEDFSKIHLESSFCFPQKTDRECSLVCLTSEVPNNVIRREDGWRSFRIAGELDFSLVGTLASIAELLAKQNISIFAVSTFATDYLLIKEAQFQKALALLAQHGYSISEERKEKT